MNSVLATPEPLATATKHTRRPRAVATAAAAIFACLLWASAFPVIKVGMSYFPDRPLTFAGIRFMLAGLILMPLCIGQRPNVPRLLLARWRFVGLVSLLQTVILYSLFFIGLRLADADKSSIVSGASPLVAAVMAHFLMHNDRMSWAKTGAIMMGMGALAALLVLTGKDWTIDSQRQLAGMVLLLVANASGTLASIVVARSDHGLPPLGLNSAQMGMGGVVILAGGLLIEGLPPSLPPWQFFTALGWLAFVSAAAFTTWFALLKHVSVSRLTMWKFVIPVFGAILSWMLVPGESPTAAMILCMTIVAASVLLSQWQDARASRSAVTSSAVR